MRGLQPEVQGFHIHEDVSATATTTTSTQPMIARYEDDYTMQPSGDSSPEVGCGIIELE